MANSLLALQPHKVSTDLSGYITYIYGAYKTGKTTLATEMGSALLLAFERGYNALPGVIPKDITSWVEMRKTFKELKDPEVKKIFKAVVVDTVDVAADYCKKYICMQEGISDLGDLGYGKGYVKFKDEFNEIFRGLTQMGYAVFFIGHDKEAKDNNGNITNIRPALSNSTREVIAGMADIYAYTRQESADQNSVMYLRDPSGFIECGCRFKYVPNKIPTNYKILEQTIQDAIQTEAEQKGKEFITDERMEAPKVIEYDFEALIEEFNSLASALMEKDPDRNGPEIQRLIKKSLGEGHTIKNATRVQAPLISLIIDDIKNELM